MNCLFRVQKQWNLIIVSQFFIYLLASFKIPILLAVKLSAMLTCVPFYRFLFEKVVFIVLQLRNLIMTALALLLEVFF